MRKPKIIAVHVNAKRRLQNVPFGENVQWIETLKQIGYCRPPLVGWSENGDPAEASAHGKAGMWRRHIKLKQQVTDPATYVAIVPLQL